MVPLISGDEFYPIYEFLFKNLNKPIMYYSSNDAVSFEMAEQTSCGGYEDIYYHGLSIPNLWSI